MSGYFRTRTCGAADRRPGAGYGLHFRAGGQLPTKIEAKQDPPAQELEGSFGEAFAMAAEDAEYREDEAPATLIETGRAGSKVQGLRRAMDRASGDGLPVDPWIRAPCNPKQARAMANQVGAEFVIPVHHCTFKLSNEPLKEPIERLFVASGSAEDRIPIREIGGEFHLSTGRLI